MPYVLLNSKRRRLEGKERAAPKASDFEYLPAKELGGPSDPAKLRMPTGTEPNSRSSWKLAHCIWR
jgi:hypothetical protein